MRTTVTALATVLGLALSGAALFAAPGCNTGTCLSGSADCAMPSPCEKLSFSCESGSVKAYVLKAGDPIPAGLDALASPGDFVLENDQVVAVIDALDHAHYVAPTGGTLIDLARKDGVDSLNQVLQATGLLPGDAAHYDDARIVEGDGVVAVQVSGWLDGRPDLRIATRYELRPCESGVRIRTEAANLEPDAAIWSLTDGWYWSGRENLPFTPTKGTGFTHPSFGLTTVTDVFDEVPYLVATAHAAEAASYVDVACDRPTLAGFQSDQISAMGTTPRVVPPRDTQTFERFIGVVNGVSVAPGADLALELRRQLFGETFAALDGRLVDETGAPVGGDEARATVIVSEGTKATKTEDRVPWTQVSPGADGTFSVSVPPDRGYVVEVQAFGRTVLEAEVAVQGGPAHAGELTVPRPGTVHLAVTRDGAPGDGQVLFQPADDATREAVTARLFDAYTTCAPLLGSPIGGSPACNRVLVSGEDSVAVPPGRYEVYAVAGPFRTIGRELVTVEAGGTYDLAFALDALPLQPEGTLSADFHVHGGESFDSSIPDLDRVRAFLAADIDVIAATDHDVVWDYANAIEALNARDRLALVTGVETTGHILWKLDPNDYVPKVIGHWIFWPLTFDPAAPRRGMPWDEEVEPAGLIARMKDAGWKQDTGVAQLNHPFSEAEFGRDLGYPVAIGMDLTKPLPPEWDGTSMSQFNKLHPDLGLRNSDYNVQEVMNGTENNDLLKFRAFWFYLLDQGLVRGGTANSDSHSLYDSILGTPRNLVWTSTTVADFDETALAASVRAGHMVGTNGPVIEASMQDDAGEAHGPALAAFAPGSDRRLTLKVSAAPWVPVTEVRIVVNGTVAKTLTSELSHPADPFGKDGLVRYEGELDLAPLLPASGDAWVVVEAGTALPVAGDLSCDGVPDTTDNDGSGTIDWKDVDRNGDHVVDAADQDVNEDGKVDAADVPAACEGGTGPLLDPPVPEDAAAPLHVYDGVTPGGYPYAFTNPFILDLDGGGYAGPHVLAGGTN